MNQFASIDRILKDQLIDDDIHFIGEGNKKNILAVTEHGVYQFGGGNEFQFYPFVNSVFEQVKIFPLSISMTASNDVYVTSESGFYKFSGDKWFVVYEGVSGSINFHSLIIAQLIEDKDMNLWLATDEHGLIKLSIDGTYRQFLKKDGLLDNAVRSIYLMGQDVWVGSDKGIVKIVKINDQYVIKRFSHPLLRSELQENAVVYDEESKQLYFAGVKGVIAFNPFTYDDVNIEHELQLTGFRLFNDDVAIGDVLPSSISYADQIVLDYHQYIISLEFSTLNYSNSKHYYAYRLNGLGNNEWVKTDFKNRRAVYTSLDPGNYEFEVKAEWYPGQWSSKTASLKISILPPWYMTFWAYGFYIIAIIASIVLYIHWRTLSFRRRAQELEVEVAARTDEISTQKNTIERLMDKKNEMFANISHELRTSLTLINGPIDKVANKLDNSSVDKKSLSLAKRNTQRLSYLVDQLLQLSRMYYLQEEKMVDKNRIIFTQRDATYDEVNCSNADAYVVSGDDKGFESHLALLISAYLSEKRVKLVLKGCASKRPRIVSVTM